MKIVGFILLVATGALGFLKFDNLSLWSAGLGIAMGAGIFIMMGSFRSEKPAAPSVEHNNPWQSRFHDLETQSTQTIEGLNREVQKLQQKLLRTEERCLSYQKLVDVHQGEIDRFKQENGQLCQQLVENNRKVMELQLARMEPELFDTEKRQTESSYRELKKQFEEKSHALDQARSQLFRVENELLAFQKEKEEAGKVFTPTEMNLIDQLKQTEDEKKKLESELVSLQQLVSELSLSKNKVTRKKGVQSESRDLLG